MSAYALFPAGGAPYTFPLDRTTKFSTVSHVFENGAEQTRQKWTRDKLSFSLTFTDRTKQEMDTLWAFFRDHKGKALPFLFDDPRADNITAEAVGTGDGVAVAFSLVRRFVMGSPALAVFLNGAPTSAFTLADDAGIITFASPPGAGVAITANYRSAILCKFKTDELKESQTQYQVFTASVEIEEVFP